MTKTIDLQDDFTAEQREVILEAIGLLAAAKKKEDLAKRDYKYYKKAVAEDLISRIPDIEDPHIAAIVKVAEAGVKNSLDTVETENNSIQRILEIYKEGGEDE